MSYYLGVDIGTCFTAAAVHRDGKSEIVDLGSRRPQIPTTVYIPHDDKPIIGDAAERRAASDPLRVAREFKRRLGDDIGLLIGEQFWHPEALMALVLDQVVNQVTAREGGPAELVALTHPANWGPFKLERLAEVTRLAGLDRVTYVAEPVAAALHHTRSQNVGDPLCHVVYDLGGGTFDVAIVRTDERGSRIIGKPEGLERLGGIDFDNALRAVVDADLDGQLTQFDPTDEQIPMALAQLSEQIVIAKEALSIDTAYQLPLFLPGLPGSVRITRAEFEAAIHPRLLDAIGVTERVITSARTPDDTLTDPQVLLVGGSSAIPAVAQTITEHLGLPIAVDEHPKHAVAMGAARWAATADIDLSGPASRRHRLPADVDTSRDPSTTDDGNPSRDSHEAGASSAVSTTAMTRHAVDTGPTPTIPNVDDLEPIATEGSTTHYRGRLSTHGDRTVRVSVLPANVRHASPRWIDAIVSTPRHPNLVDVLGMDVLPRDGTRYILTEWSPAAPLSKLTTDTGPLTLADVVGVGVQLCAGLATIHRHGLAHGALSPDTMLVVSTKPIQIKLDGLGTQPVSSSARSNDCHQLAEILRQLAGVQGPRSLIDALDTLSAHAENPAAVEDLGHSLQQIQLASQQIPTELRVLGPTSSPPIDAFAPSEPPQHPKYQPPEPIIEPPPQEPSMPRNDEPTQPPSSRPPHPPPTTSTRAMAGWGRESTAPRDAPRPTNPADANAREPDWVRAVDAARSTHTPQTPADRKSRLTTAAVGALMLAAAVVLIYLAFAR